MELLSVIRRWHFRDRFSIREISRRTGLSRSAVRRYLRSGSEEPKFNILTGRASSPRMLTSCRICFVRGGEVAQAKADLKQLHADLLALGYDGSYNRLAAFARDWKDAR